jgi:hypothetical protein
VDQQRRFPTPWYVHRSSAETFQVLDANGKPLAHVDCKPSDHLTELEAWTLAASIARIPEFMKKRDDLYLDLMHPVMKRILK